MNTRRPLRELRARVVLKIPPSKITWTALPRIATLATPGISLVALEATAQIPSSKRMRQSHYRMIKIAETSRPTLSQSPAASCTETSRVLRLRAPPVWPLIHEFRRLCASHRSFSRSSCCYLASSPSQAAS